MVMDTACIYDIAPQYVALPGASLRRKRKLEAPEAYGEGAEVMHGGGGRMTPGEGSIVVLTGAGISVELGLPSFRGAGGLWEGWRLEDVATPEAFARDPAIVQRFYDQRRRQLLGQDVRPNAAHLALAELEHRWPGEVLIVTQNIDDLHERAGTRNLIHMHGELLKARCIACESVHPWRSDLAASHRCPGCAGENRLRPHVVWFGEMPLDLHRIYAALRACDLFVAIGTSGQVYPAAGFVEAARAAGRAHTVELNLGPSGVNSRFAEHRQGPATELVPRFVAELVMRPVSDEDVESGPVATGGTGPSDEGGLDEREQIGSLPAAEMAAGGGDADTGGSGSDASAAGAGLGDAADRARAGMQPHDGAALPGAGRLARLPGAAAQQGSGRRRAGWRSGSAGTGAMPTWCARTWRGSAASR